MSSLTVSKKALAVSALAAGVALAGSAFAATPAIKSVGSKMDRQYEATGTKLCDDLLVIPRLDASLIYDDNIYATDTNTQGDLITRVRPSVELRSKAKNYYVSALGRVDLDRYHDKKGENTAGYLASLYGSRDLTEATNVNGKLQYSRRFEDRDDPNSPSDLAKPIAYNYGLARGAVSHDIGKIGLKASTEIDSYDYHDSYTLGGSAVDSDYRDRTDYVQGLEAGYQLNDTFQPFVRLGLDKRVYDRKAPLNRGSNGYRVKAGTDMVLMPNVKASLYGGYMVQDYSAGALTDIHSPDFGGNVTWNVNDTTSVMGSISREIEETTRTGSSGIVETVYAADVEKALRSDLLLLGGLSFVDDSYEGPASFQRNDDIWNAYVGLRYFLKKGVALDGQYSYRDRDSNINTGDYSRDRVMVKLSLSY